MMTLCKGQGGTPADRPMRAWHDSWQVVSMAANSGLILTKIIPFKADEYRVYTSTGFRLITCYYTFEINKFKTLLCFVPILWYKCVKMCVCETFYPNLTFYHLYFHTTMM